MIISYNIKNKQINLFQMDILKKCGDIKIKMKITIFDGVVLGFLVNNLINIFNVKKIPFFYYGVFLIILLISDFMVDKGIVTKNWWKKFIPFYILNLILKNSDSMDRIILYFGTLIILSIVFILLLIKFFLRKNKDRKMVT